MGRERKERHREREKQNWEIGKWDKFEGKGGGREKNT